MAPDLYCTFKSQVTLTSVHTPSHKESIFGAPACVLKCVSGDVYTVKVYNRKDINWQQNVYVREILTHKNTLIINNF